MQAKLQWASGAYYFLPIHNIYFVYTLPHKNMQMAACMRVQREFLNTSTKFDPCKSAAANSKQEQLADQSLKERVQTECITGGYP